MSTVESYPYNNTAITTQTTTVVKPESGTLVRLVIPTPVANATVKVYDHPSAASGAVLVDTITLPGTLLSSGPVTVELGCRASWGITVVTAGATMSVHVVWI